MLLAEDLSPRPSTESQSFPNLSSMIPQVKHTSKAIWREFWHTEDKKIREYVAETGWLLKDTARAPADTDNHPLPRITLLHTQNLADKLKLEDSRGQKTW
ncbi:hypothetical protein LINPERPRIM_LOCUS37890, partial [Linum perenne]